MQTGYSLIEMLVSILILSLMLLGFDAMQIVALQKAKATYYFSVATQQLTIMSARAHMQNNIDEEQLQAWNAQNQAVLPQGRGTVSGNILSIFWGNMTGDICNQNTIGQSGCLFVKI